MGKGRSNYLVDNLSATVFRKGISVVVRKESFWRVVLALFVCVSLKSLSLRPTVSDFKCGVSEQHYRGLLNARARVILTYRRANQRYFAMSILRDLVLLVCSL